MDIKIETVFSLANENKQDSSRSWKEQRDSNQEPKPDMIVIKEEVHDPGYDFAELCEKNQDRQWLNGSTDSADSEDLPFDIGVPAHGADTPPALSMEKDIGMFRAMLYDKKRECMPPPVLMPQIGFQREEISNDEDKSKEISQERKKKSMKIFPCYIVLTKVDRYLDSQTRISHRTFRKTHRECLNICKHVNFRRKLEAGQDVFNVKVPSKHKNYQAYLELHRKRHKSSRSKSCPKRENLFKGLFENKTEKRFKDLIEKYKKSIHGRGAGRVMRSVQCVPKDFVRGLNKAWKMPAIAKFISEARQHVLDETEKEIAHKRDLARLKNQIEFKRSTNKTKKQYRLHQTEHIPAYFRSGTSVVSGRVRKMNTRYGNDFARSKDEEHYFHSLSMISEKMRRDKKRIMEGKDEKNDSSKGGDFELVLDNAETLNEGSFVRLERHGNEFKSSTEDPDMSNKERERINSRRREKYHQKQVEKAQDKVFHDTEDGVIIKDIPDECSVLTSLLLSSYSNNNNTEVNPDSPIKTEKPYYEENSAGMEQFSYVKSLLKRSSDYDDRNTIWEPVSKRTKSFMPVNEGRTETTNAVNPENTEMDPERARLLRIPDKVRQLFVKKDTPKPDVRETENSDKDTSQPSNYKPSYSLIKVKDNKLPQRLVATGIPIASRVRKGSQEIQKFVITSKGLAKPIVHVGLDVSKSKAIPDFMTLTTHVAPRDYVAQTAAKNHSPFPKPVLLFENTGDLGKISSVCPKAPTPRTTTAPNSVSLIKIPAAGTLSSGNGPGTNVSLQTFIPLSTASDARSQASNKNASLNETKSPSTSVPVKSPVSVSSKAEANNSYYYFQVSGKNIIIPVKQGADQQKAIVLNSVKPADAKPAQTKISTVCVKGNQVSAMTVANKLQQQPTLATSHKIGDNMVALIPQANSRPLVVPLTPVRPPAVEPILTPNTQVIRVFPDGRIDTSQSAVKSLPTDNKPAQPVVSEGKQQVLRMYPDGRTVLCSNSNPVRFTGPSLLNSFNGKRFALIPSSLPQNTLNKNSDGTVSAGVPIRFPLIPATLTTTIHSTQISSTVLQPISSTPRNSTVVTTTQTVYQKASSSPGRPRRASTLPVHGPNSVEVSSLSKGSEKPNGNPKGSVGIPTIARTEVKVSDTINNESVKSLEKEGEPDQNQEKPMAFSEATTAREEKLRRLKELLKEHSMAVDKLREQRKNVDSESDDT